MLKRDSKILVVGHGDVLDRSLYKYFKSNGYTSVDSTDELAFDTTIQSSVYQYFGDVRPEFVFLCSVKSGGIEVNRQNPADFFYANNESQNNIIYSSHKFGVKKLLYYAGSCVYPRNCPQPMAPEHILSGPFEPTSQAYSTAKLAGLMMCKAYRAQFNFKAMVAIPATVYGPGSDTDIASAHVMGALIKKFSDAVSQNDASVSVWGSGLPRREFLYVDDFVRASLFLMNEVDHKEPINIGCGQDISIKELSEMISRISGFTGTIQFDAEKPDGAPQKLLDTSVIVKKGWSPEINLEEGILQTIKWYKERLDQS